MKKTIIGLFLLATSLAAQVQLGKGVQLGAGSGATLPTGAPVFGLTPLTSRAATAPDIVNLWASGTCAGFLKNDGTCGSGGTPAGSPQDAQFNLNGTDLGADHGLYTYSAGTHTLSTVNQAMSGFFNQAATNLPVTHGVESDTSAPFDSTGRGSNSTNLITTNSWGLGKNVGNPGVFSGQPGADASGWRVSLGIDVEMNVGSSGIHQGMHLNPFVHGSGDSAVIYEGNSEGFSPCMWVDASGEGCVGLFINGTQYVCIATGTITSPPTTGNWSPVFNIIGGHCNGDNTLTNDGIIIDTDVTVLATNITGQSISWSGPNGNVGSLPVTPGSATLSTGIGVLTQAIPQSSAVDSNGARTGAYQTQPFVYTTSSGTITTGPVFIANDSTPEQCKIIAVGGSPTISCAKYHPSGAVLFQNGAQGLLGFGDFDDDMAKTSLHDVVYVLGASDTNHLLIAERVAGSFKAENLPTRGVMAAGATLTGGFTVHPGALCVNTNQGNSQCTLEYNTAAWTAGHHFASPTGLPMTEVMGNFFSSQTAPDSPQSGGYGLSVLFESGTQHSWIHPFIGLTNAADRGKYGFSGVSGGWLSAPPAIDVSGPMGNFAQFDMSLLSTGLDQTPCGGATLFCNKNGFHLASTQVIKLYADAQASEAIWLDGPNSQFRFRGWNVLIDGNLTVTGTTSIAGVALLAAANTFTAQNTFQNGSFDTVVAFGNGGAGASYKLFNGSKAWNWALSPAGGFAGVVPGNSLFMYDESDNFVPFWCSLTSCDFKVPVAFDQGWSINGSPTVTGLEGIGTKILSYTGAIAAGNLIGTDVNGTGIDSGVNPSTVAILPSNNTFVGSNVFTGTTSHSTVTAATAILNQSSPPDQFGANYWTGSASASCQLTWRLVPAAGTNPVETMGLTASGCNANVLTQLPSLGTTSNCASAASPAACGSASSGNVVIAASASSVTVNTSAITANSQIVITPDDSLGSRLSVTCNSTLLTVLSSFGVTARVPGTSFTISTSSTPTANPACFNYTIIN